MVTGNDRRSLESRLREAYAAQRPHEDVRAREACVRAVCSELTSVVPVTGFARSRPSLARFAFGQVRFIRKATWLALGALGAMAFLACSVWRDDHLVSQLLSATASLLSLVCLINVTESRACHMAELEGSCRFSAVSVALARMVVTGGASLALMLVATVVAASSAAGFAVSALLWMGTPYALVCAGGLLLARRVRTSDALAATAIWAAGVMVASLLLFTRAPAAYETAALWGWGIAFIASATWCACEARRWIDAAAESFTAQRRISTAAPGA